ncbi:MAG: class I SAM-dependent methyltransferase [Actinomycetes bacterium]
METPSGSWFNALASYLGPAYLRNAFTYGTVQEIDFIIEILGLRPGMRVLDVGCGPGRHSLELSRRGYEVTGVDLSPEFINLAVESAGSENLSIDFEMLDVRDLAFEDEFDAVICLCQGGFGLLGGDDDGDVFLRLSRAVKPGGGVVVSAFSSYFALHHLEQGEEFDPRVGVLHEVSTLRNSDGLEAPFDLWTTCFTSRELLLLGAASGLVATATYGVTPGDYGVRPPALDRPEILFVASRGSGL